MIEGEKPVKATETENLGKTLTPARKTKKMMNEMK